MTQEELRQAINEYKVREQRTTAYIAREGKMNADCLYKFLRGKTKASSDLQKRIIQFLSTH